MVVPKGNKKRRKKRKSFVKTLQIHFHILGDEEVKSTKKWISQ